MKGLIHDTYDITVTVESDINPVCTIGLFYLFLGFNRILSYCLLPCNFS